ncbi:hypothetical protein E2C01_101705 [Portunus trituberculatus]|uniref:Uncharacterized protein n=1 Tax=Portunus trituberculatus TaxID=210409 RepID=A0A5B7KBD3_PORTR|nr:hypothetical protein [Portunus trituberculatus]
MDWIPVTTTTTLNNNGYTYNTPQNGNRFGARGRDTQTDALEQLAVLILGGRVPESRLFHSVFHP